MKRVLIIGGVVIVAIIIAVAYFLYSSLDSIVAAAIEKYGSQYTGTQVRVDGVDLDLTSGKGAITDLATGETHEIKPGVMYALDKHDRHILKSDEELVMACCFNPPVTGTEVHREDGSYAPADEQ